MNLMQWAAKELIVLGEDPQTHGVLDRKPIPGDPKTGYDYTMYQRWNFLTESNTAKAMAFLTALLGGTPVVPYEDPQYEGLMDEREVRRNRVYIISLEQIPAHLQERAQQLDNFDASTNTLKMTVGSLFSMIYMDDMEATGKLEWLKEPSSSGQLFKFTPTPKVAVKPAFHYGDPIPGFKYISLGGPMGPFALVPDTQGSVS